MKIELNAQQQAWLQAQVAAGMFQNTTDALGALFPVEGDGWVKPYIDAALADVDSGRVVAWNAAELHSELQQRYPEVLRDTH